MEFRKTETKDIKQILNLIKKEFPELEFTNEDLQNKIESEKFLLFVLSEKESIVGFVEIENLEGDVVRINALIIDSTNRGKKLGKELLEKTISFLKQKKVIRVKILVDQNNEKAKNLYQELGFGFVSLYQLSQTGQTVEELELDLDTDTPSYVS